LLDKEEDGFQELKRKARLRIEAAYSFSKMINSYEKLYE
jgi:hypothetical protein